MSTHVLSRTRRRNLARWRSYFPAPSFTVEHACATFDTKAWRVWNCVTENAVIGAEVERTLICCIDDSLKEWYEYFYLIGRVNMARLSSNARCITCAYPFTPCKSSRFRWSVSIFSSNVDEPGSLDIDDERPSVRSTSSSEREWRSRDKFWALST